MFQRTLLLLRQVTYGAFTRLSKVLGVLFLGASVSWAQPTATILALGDSLTQGYGLPDHEGLVPQLQAWLGENGRDVRVLNGGVSGDTTAGGLDRVEWLLMNDVDGVIVALGGNDVLRGLPPAMSRDNLHGILSILRDRGLPALIVGMYAPGNFGPDYKAEFDAIYPDLAREFSALYVPSFFDALLEGTENLQAIQEFMQDDGIHPNRDGVRKIVAYIGPRVIELIDQETQ